VPEANGLQYEVSTGVCWAEIGMSLDRITPSGNYKHCYFPDNLKECKKVDTCTVGDDTTQGNCGDKS
jgi:hypothetical protein